MSWPTVNPATWLHACSARTCSARTPITDGLGKPFVWRAKDFWNWWSDAHYDRPDGHESATPTAWVPQSKPIWFCELGCPAIDKGANRPNVFFDPKSSESALPYYSNGERDDLVQRAFLQAHLDFWSGAGNNPSVDEAAMRSGDARAQLTNSLAASLRVGGGFGRQNSFGP